MPYRLYVEKDGALTEISSADAKRYPAGSIIKKASPRWDNFVKAIQAMKMFPTYLKNTLILCLLTVTGTVLSSSLAAYGFSRIEWREASGRGTVYALSVMHLPATPEYKDRVPYIVAMIDLDEGARMMSNVFGVDPADAAVGMAVQIAWEDLDDGRALPVFEPAG